MLYRWGTHITVGIMVLFTLWWIFKILDMPVVKPPTWDCTYADERDMVEFRRDCYASDEYAEVCDRKAKKLYCTEVPHED